MITYLRFFKFWMKHKYVPPELENIYSNQKADLITLKINQ